MNYAEIVQAVEGFSDRSDIDIVSMLSTFVLMTEARINRKLTADKMSLLTNTICIENKVGYALPNGFLAFRSVNILAVDGVKGVKLDYVTPEVFLSTNCPNHCYTIMQGELHINPIQTSSNYIELLYYVSVPNLNSIDSSNWLSDTYPDCYIFGLLTQLCNYVKDFEVAQIWESKFLTVLQEISDFDAKSTWSGPLTMSIQ